MKLAALSCFPRLSSISIPLYTISLHIVFMDVLHHRNSTVVWNSTLCSHTINMSNNISIANNITNIMRGFTAGFMNIPHSECNVFIYCLHSWLNKRHRTRMLSSLKREIESAKGHQRYFYKKYWVKLLTTKRK